MGAPTVDQFIAGCFDCGYGVSLFLEPEGFVIWVYEGSWSSEARSRRGMGHTWADAFADYQAQDWDTWRQT
jgi:hypothetical protein